MFRRVLKIIITPLAVLILLLPARQNIPDETRSKRLKSLKEQIEGLKNQLRKISEQKKSILSKISRLKTLNSLKLKELKGYRLEIKSTESDIKRLRSRIKTLEEEIKVLKEYLSKRLRQLYKLGRLNTLKVLVSSEGSGHLRRNYKYLKIVAKKHHGKISAFRKTKRKLGEKKRELGVKLQKLKDLKSKAERKSDELSKTKRNLENTLRSIRQDKRKREELLKEFQKAARSLENLIKGLGEKETNSQTVPSLKKVKGLLNWPLKGKVTLEYGKIEHPRFKTITFHKGLDIQASLGEKVRTVYDGNVVFSDWFEGYGKTVIIDHKKNFFTVYAHLSEIEVEKGDFVATSQRIGKVGQSGSLKGSYLYFELRKGDKALNPRNWLKER